MVKTEERTVASGSTPSNVVYFYLQDTCVCVCGGEIANGDSIRCGLCSCIAG